VPNSSDSKANLNNYIIKKMGGCLDKFKRGANSEPTVERKNRYLADENDPESLPE